MRQKIADQILQDDEIESFEVKADLIIDLARELEDIATDALKMFKCTQRPYEYPQSHWSNRLILLLSANCGRHPECDGSGDVPSVGVTPIEETQPCKKCSDTRRPPMTAEKTLLTDILELIDAWEGGIRTGDPDRGVNGDADKELAALAKVRAHIKQLETRCAELERENAEVMLSDQGRLRSKLASYENQIAELRRDRERLRDALTAIRDHGGPDRNFQWRTARDTITAMRDSRTENASGEASPPANG